jgi:hypothetical protein
VEFGAVTFVLAETVFRKLNTKVTHHHVARHLGNHARGRDGQAVAIAVDDRGLRKRKGNHRTSIDQDMFGRTHQRVNGGAHRLVRRAQDVDPIDLEVIDHADRP